MNLKKILSGTAALLAVGMFYAFTFCIVQETDVNAVPTEPYSNDGETAQGDAAEKAGENTAYENVGAKGVPVFDSAVTGGIMPVSNMPDISNGSVPVSVSISGDEITDAYYLENSDLDLESFSEEELEGLPVDDDVNEYEDVSLNSKNYASDSKEEEEGARTTKSKKNKKKKPSYPDDEMLIIEYTDEGSNSSAPKGAVMQKDESGWDGSLNVADQAGSGKVNTSDYVNEDEDYPSGEYFTARVHGEVSNYDAYELVCMIVANEMSPSFAPEALKAQAVAAYSYLKYHSYKGLTPSVLTRTPIPAEVEAAVAEVWGLCCYYDGVPAETVYTASTSGYTASAANVWGGNGYPYLISHECPFDAESDPNYGIQTSWSEEEMRTRLERFTGGKLSDDPSKWLIVTEYEDGNYVKEVLIDGKYTATGIQIRENVMSYKLKSASFEVSYSDGQFTFTTYGYGHGVGMSQNGANFLAKQGYTFEDILKFYYHGITVQ